MPRAICTARPPVEANGDGTVFELAAGSTSLTTLMSFNGIDGKYLPRSAGAGCVWESLWGDQWRRPESAWARPLS